MRVALAGVVCELDIDDAVGETLIPRYRAYRSDGPVDLRCRVRAVPGLRVEVADDARYPAAMASFSDGRYQFQRRDFTATLDLAAGELEVSAVPSPAAEAALRMAVSLVLPRRGGLLLHSSGVVDGGLGYVFSGVSGAGKTTTVRLLAPRLPLGDNLVALIPEGEEFRALATPFAGEYGVVAPASAPLARLYFLEQSDAHARRALTVVEARQRVLRNTLAYVRDAETAGLLQDVAARIATRVACAQVRFTRDAGIARWLDAGEGA